MILKKIISVFIITLIISQVYSQNYYFSENNGKDGLIIKSSKSDLIECSFAIDQFHLSDIEVEKTSMKNISWGSAFLPGKEGEPQLPSITKNFIIPQGSKVDIQIRNSTEKVFNNVLIAPAAKTPVNSMGESFPAIRGPIYSQNSLYPTKPISYHITEIRGMQMLVLSIIPFQYNPVTKELRVNSHLEIDIHIKSSSSEYIADKYRSPYWDQIISDIVFNIDDLPQIDYNQRKFNKENEGCEFLIITPNRSDFLQWASIIKQFRSEQGIYTKVLNTEEIGGNNADIIKSFFEEMYESWDPVPSAVLLLGDWGGENDGILSKGFTDHPEHVGYISDSYYSDATNNELPDFVLGRISANDSIELKTIITKYINYERKPSLDTHAYQNPLVLSAFEDRLWFQICSESINGYMKNSLGKTPIRINEFTYQSELIDKWSIANNTSLPVNYFGIEGLKYIPETPAEAGNWGGSNYQQVISAINTGASLTFFRDHGGEDQLWRPNLQTSHIPLLINKRHPTFLFAFGCYGGAFNYRDPTIIEALHTHITGGIIGGIAATTRSFSFYNDAILWGITDNLWPSFMPDYGNNSTITKDFRPAFGLVASKYYMMNSNWIPDDSIRVLTSRVWSHFGDPFGCVYTNTPMINPVEHPFSLSTSSQSIKITAVPYSLIAISKNGELLDSKISGVNGEVTLNFAAQEELTKLKLVVSKQNYIRYEKDIYFIPENGSYAFFTNYTLFDANNDAFLENNESAEVDISIRNYGNDIANNVKLKITNKDPFIKILSDSIVLIDRIIANSEITLDKVLKFRTNNNTPNQHETSFSIDIINNDHITSASFNVTVDASSIEFSNIRYEEIEGNDNNLPDPGETLKVSFNISNTGHLAITNNEISITPTHPDIQNSINSFQFDTLLIGKSVGISFEMEVSNSALSENTYANICRLTTSKGNYSKYYYFHGSPEIEDWETGDFNKYEWYFEGDKDWEIDEDFSIGDYSATIQGLGDNEEAALCINYHVWMDDYIKFSPYIITEENKDILSFYIDTTLINFWSRFSPWIPEEYLVSKGDHIFKWIYKKDSTGSFEDDACWIDNIQFPVGQKITSIDKVPRTNEKTIFLSPNPANDFIYVTNNSSSIIKQIIILNILGEPIKTYNLNQNENKNIDLNTLGLSPGVYLCEFILNSGKSQTQKLIIQ